MKKNGLMDYSLLLGIEKINKFEIFMPGNNMKIRKREPNKNQPKKETRGRS